MGNFSSTKIETVLSSLTKKDIKKYKYSFFALLLLCFALSVVYIYITTPVYQIQANVLIKDEAEKSNAGMSSMLKGFSFGGFLSGGAGNVDDELLLMNSYSLVKDVVKELKLNVSYTSTDFVKKKDYYNNTPIQIVFSDSIASSFLKNKLTFKLTQSGSGKVRIVAKEGWGKIADITVSGFPYNLQTEYGTFRFEATSFFSPKTFDNLKISFLGYDYTAEKFLKNLIIKIAEKKANGIYLSIEETNVQRGKDFLNKIVALYNDRGIDQKNISAQRTADFLQERIELNTRDLENVEREIEEFKKVNNLTDIEVEAKILLEKNGDFKEKLIDSEIQYATVQLIEDFLKAPENRYALAPLNLGITEKTAAEGLQQYNNFLLERAKLLQTTKGDNPAVLMLNKQIEVLRQNVLETFKSIKAGFDVARNDLKKQEKEFNARIGGMPTQERKFLDIKRQQMVKSELYLFLLQQKEENAMTMARSMPRAQIIDAAYSLLDPVKPNPLFVFSIALIIAFFIPIVIIAYKVLVKN
nr:GNVR domain-containing protein [uncultured Macellibacteroides sp.]